MQVYGPRPQKDALDTKEWAGKSSWGGESIKVTIIFRGQALEKFHEAPNGYYCDIADLELLWDREKKRLYVEIESIHILPAREGTPSPELLIGISTPESLIGERVKSLRRS